MKCFISVFAALALAIAATGCGDSHEHKEGAAGSGEHHHEAPHGGTLVELGKHEFNIEFVLDATGGMLTAYVLDAHASKFLRVAMEKMEIILKTGARTETLVLKPVASSATGEKVGDTSQFQAQADGLKGVTAFDGMLKEVNVRGISYTFVSFKFPK